MSRRCAYMTHATYVNDTRDKRDLHIWQKKPTYVAHICKSPWGLQLQIGLWHVYDKRDLHIWQKRLTCMAQERTHMREYSRITTADKSVACIYDKRDLHIWQKRLTCMAKESYICGTNMQESSRITTAGKSWHVYDKRDPDIWHTRSTYMT